MRAIMNYCAALARSLEVTNVRARTSASGSNREPRAIRRDPSTARDADLEAGALLKMPVRQEGPLRSAGAHDQAHCAATDRTLRLGSSG